MVLIFSIHIYTVSTISVVLGTPFYSRLVEMRINNRSMEVSHAVIVGKLCMYTMYLS